MKYVALLRGINVGGSNIIRMAELKKCFEGMGFDNVQTYIQSGNVLFSGTGAVGSLEKKIEKSLARKFKYDPRVLIVPHAKLKDIIKKAPRGFGKEPKKYRYDVVFLKKPLTTASAMKVIEIRDGVDNAYRGQHVLYSKRLIAKATQSRFPKIVSKPEYQYMTIRNWNTTSRLLSLLDSN